MAAAKPQDLAAHQDQFAAEHIVGGDAVFQAVNAARILRHIAADGAGDLRGRIGRVVEAGMIDRLRDRKIGDAWLDTATRFSKSMARMRLNLAMPSRTPSPSGSAPPDSDVPAPAAPP
jgi:hypothetical protein